MKQYAVIFYWGLLISFFGSLPPGVINIAAAQISHQQSNGAAMIYALGAMLAEITIVRISFYGMKKIMNQKWFFIILEIMTLGMLIAFTGGCFIAAGQKEGVGMVIPGYYLPPFKTGLFLSLLNPLHIPFWLGWVSLLMNRRIISPTTKQFNCLTAGIGVGTMAGFMAFIYSGEYLFRLLQHHQFALSLSAGLFLLFFTLLHIRKLIRTPVSSRYSDLKSQIARSG